MSEYNRDQLTTIRAVREGLAQLSPSEREAIGESMQPYLQFREAVDRFFARHLLPDCRQACFETGLSACCGFESIITFFADHVINILLSEKAELDRFEEILGKPNASGKCVYLRPTGCLWRVRPLTCAMFLCGQAKETCFGAAPELGEAWSLFKEEEKVFIWPNKPVLFDQLEARFLLLGAESPHLYFHRSPGLLRVKEKAGLWKRAPSRERNGS